MCNTKKTINKINPPHHRMARTRRMPRRHEIVKRESVQTGLNTHAHTPTHTHTHTHTQREREREREREKRKQKHSKPNMHSRQHDRCYVPTRKHKMLIDTRTREGE